MEEFIDIAGNALEFAQSNGRSCEYLILYAHRGYKNDNRYKI